MSTQAPFDPVTEEPRLANHIAHRVVARLSGRATEECHDNYPHDRYFVGALRPRPPAGEHDDYLSELISKLAPTAFGLEVGLEDPGSAFVVRVELSWACYFRVFPTLEQQRSRRAARSADAADKDGSPGSSARSQPVVPDDADEKQRESDEEAARLEAEGASEALESQGARRRRRRARTDRMFPRFRKIPCAATGLIRFSNQGSGWQADTSNLVQELSEECRRAQSVVGGSEDRVRTRSGSPSDLKVRIPDERLASPEAYESFIASLTHEVVPQWSWEVQADVCSTRSTQGAPFALAIRFVNSSPTSDDPNAEPFLFDACAAIELEDANAAPFRLHLAPEGFRYDPWVWGRGFNCSVENEARTRFSTSFTPIHEQPRYVTQTSPQAPFADLAKDPIPVLVAIESAMSAYNVEWDEALSFYEDAEPRWRERHGNAFDADRATFQRESRAFREGLDLLRTDEDALLAFTLTNRTFECLGQHPTRPKTAWRLFQIVFLVTQLPAICDLRSNPDSDRRAQVDIIYFPTGGGKTEAYLGTIVFHCFFDRLRGKAAGVTAWTRFPLRLLTLQQTQRTADAVCVADLVRLTQQDPRLVGPGVDGFAVGYFVGQGGSPNELLDPDQYKFAKPTDHANWSSANDPQARQRWKRVPTCPACRTASVTVDFDAASTRLLHRCLNEGCSFADGVLPVYVVDNEIYRYLPSVMVGTIDKLAGIGNQRKLSQVLGHVTKRCTRHGYHSGQCCQRGCEWRAQTREQLGLDEPAPASLSGPTLFVQDELHLLKEGLGTFDGHYETFTQQLLRHHNAANSTLKIIASSATIEAFERQVEHLYGRSRSLARVFPGLGPRRGQSFYANTLAHAQRTFVGVLPHNKTIFNAILELIEHYHREVQALQQLPPSEPNPYGGQANPATEQWREMLDNYSASLSYFLATKELDAIHTDILGDINGRLRADSVEPLSTFELTGGTSTDEVSEILAHLERSAPSAASTDSVLATSMVSHGVDVDRLNAMIFYGMPRQTAEYIQASSRVGRSHAGLVFMCLHPARERDRSHYTYFTKYHEFLGQLVEPVAINRWATFSIDRTLPGLFMATLLQVIAHSHSSPGKYYRRDFVAQEITAGRLQTSDFLPMLEAAYLAHVPATVDEQEVRRRLSQLVEGILYEQICRSQEDFVSEALTPHKPMRSLRDVDELVTIELDQMGAAWQRLVSS